MTPPRLPGDPHLVTLLYLVLLIGIVALAVWIWAQLRAQKE